ITHLLDHPASDAIDCPDIVLVQLRDTSLVHVAYSGSDPLRAVRPNTERGSCVEWFPKLREDSNLLQPTHWISREILVAEPEAALQMLQIFEHALVCRDPVARSRFHAVAVAPADPLAHRIGISDDCDEARRREIVLQPSGPHSVGRTLLEQN